MTRFEHGEKEVPQTCPLLVCIVVDNPEAAKKVLDKEGITYTEVEFAQARLQHRPGEPARVASKLGGPNININYAYSGMEAVYLAKREFLSVIFTVDHADFVTYRIEGKRQFRVLPVNHP